MPIKNGHWTPRKPTRPRQTTRTTRTVNEHGVRVTVTTRRGDHTEIRSTYKRHRDTRAELIDQIYRLTGRKFQ